MACKNVCEICRQLVISQAVTFTPGTAGAPGTLAINIPAGSYANGCKYCIVVAQAIPAATTITAPVVITIGDGTEEYPLTRFDGSQVVASGIRTRFKYATIVSTDANGGVFKMLGRPCCSPVNRLAAINGTAPVAAAEGGV